MERNTAYRPGHAIDIDMNDFDAARAVEEAAPKKRSCRACCRGFGTCISVSPWVPLIGAIMIGTGLPVWAIFTRRALETTKFFSDMLLGRRTFALEQLSSNVDWVTGLSVIIMASIVGLCLVFSLLRTYQEAAQLPSTKCGTPGKVSLGAFAAVMSMITFGLWLMSVVVALLIAAQLCWLLLAFMFSTAFSQGIQPSTSTVTPQAFYDATRAALTNLVDKAASLPADSPMAAPVNSFVAAAKQGGVEACPSSCLSLGSFYVVFEAASSCMCSSAEQYPALIAAVNDTWRYLVHALCALALMGLADLWLIMNLSAQFAHAKRDIAELKTRYAPEPARVSDDAAGAVYVTTNPAYSGSPARKGSLGGRGRDTSTGNDTRKAPAPRAPATTAPAPPPPAAEALRPLLEPLAALLYDALRPRFVQLSDIDGLADLVDILQGEVLNEQHVGPRAAPVLAALRPVLAQALSDLQQRLIYRAQAFIKQEVAGLQPGPADVDFPARLERFAREDAAAAEGAPEIEPAAAEAATAEAGEGEENGPDPLARWYGPVRATLLLLSKLYRCLPPKTFAGLAHEAVAACTASVQTASRVVARSAGPLDGQLFAIMHLLLLREQIAQFDVDFAVTDTDLDFSHMRNHMRRIVSGEVSLFSLSASNAVVQMLGRSGPRVVTAQVDSKRDLEQQLKAACENFIMAVTKMAIEPMLGFITKVTAVRVSAANNPAAARPLREQAFASAEKLAEVVTRVNDAMAGPVPEAAAKARLYLANPATRAILFRPIKSNIAEAHGQIAQLLEAEYPPEEAALVPLMQPDVLGTALEF